MMKLTPIDVQQQSFRRVFRGYDAEEVAAFMEIVAQQLRESSRENNDLRGEMRRIKRELEEHRDREVTLKEAMLTAQRAIDEIKEQADKQAELVITEAELRAEKMLLDAHQRVGRVLEDIQDLKRQRTRAIEELRGILNTHEKLLEVHDDRQEEEAVESQEATVTVLNRVRAPGPPSWSEEEAEAKAKRSG